MSGTSQPRIKPVAKAASKVAHEPVPIETKVSAVQENAKREMIDMLVAQGKAFDYLIENFRSRPSELAEVLKNGLEVMENARLKDYLDLDNHEQTQSEMNADENAHLGGQR